MKSAHDWKRELYMLAPLLDAGYIEIIQRDALDSAAKVCDRYRNQLLDNISAGGTDDRAREIGALAAMVCSERIRAL